MAFLFHPSASADDLTFSHGLSCHCCFSWSRPFPWELYSIFNTWIPAVWWCLASQCSKVNSVSLSLNLFFLNYFSSSISVIYPVIQSRPSLAILFNRLHCQWKENSSSLFWANQAPLKFSIIVPQPNSDSSAAAGWLCVRWFTLSWQHLFPECSTCHSASVFSEAACLAKTQHSLIVRGRGSLYSQKKNIS